MILYGKLGSVILVHKQNKGINMNKNKELLPYYIEASKRVNYNPITGDMTWLNPHTNRVKIGQIVGSINKGGYRVMSVSLNGTYRYLKVSRLAWYITYNELPEVVDHIDGNKNHDAIDNLRSCTLQENQFNRSKTSSNTSGYKGVYWHKSNKKYFASIKLGGKKIHLGTFNCPKEASEVYESKAKELFGDFYRSPK